MLLIWYLFVPLEHTAYIFKSLQTGRRFGSCAAKL